MYFTMFLEVALMNFFIFQYFLQQHFGNFTGFYRLHERKSHNMLTNNAFWVPSATLSSHRCKM